MSGYRFTKIMLSKYIFFIAIIMVPSIVISDVKKTNDVVSNHENTEEKQWREFHTRQVIVDLHEPERRCVSILIKRKKHLRLGASKKEFDSYRDEDGRIYDFINGLRGSVSLYERQGTKVNLVHKQNLPLKTLDINESSTAISEGIGTRELIGQRLFCIKTTATRYFILSDIYSDSDEYDDYLLFFSAIHYDK